MSEEMFPSLDIAEVKKRVEECSSWYHTFEIVPGIVTPGSRDCASLLTLLERVGLPAKATGMRVADVGCRDGFFSFEMEGRGAEVIAIDRSPPGRNGFQLLRQLRASSLPYCVDNVYYITPERYGYFDTVLLLGLIYHLRNPMMALDRMRAILKPGGLLFVETVLLEESRGPASPEGLRFGKKTAPLLKPGLMQIYPAGSLNSDATNIWAPDMTCLTVMLERAQFEIVKTHAHSGRGLVCARAIEDRAKAWFQKIDYETHIYDS